MPSLEYIDHKITDSITILPQNGIPSFKADAMQKKFPDWYMILKFSVYLTECIIIIILFSLWKIMQFSTRASQAILWFITT
jgi:hypothetical protein